MLQRAYFSSVKPFINLCCTQIQARSRRYCTKNDTTQTDPTEKSNLGDMALKYKIFKDEDANVILDVHEERLKYASLLEEEAEVNQFEGINLERGVTGVFDIEDLLTVLRRDNAQSIFVASVPAHYKYVDYICVVNAKSYKHMSAIAQFVRKVYKQKRHESDLIPRLEGRLSQDWMALDLGNIALHIFSKEAREIYDLDSLWSLGPEFDKECNKKDAIVEMLQKHSVYLSDLQPAS